MASGPEAAIQAILTGLLNMQQLNMSLADRLAAESWLEEEELREERGQWGRTRKEARAEYLAFPETDQPSRGAETAGETSPSGSEGRPETTGSQRSRPRGCCMTPSWGLRAGSSSLA